MHRKRTAAALALTLVLALIPTSALAAPADSPAAEPAAVSTEKFDQVAGDQTTGQAKALVDSHIDSTMRSSGMVAPSDVEVWTTEVDGTDVAAVIPDGSVVESAAVVTDAAEDTDIAAFGVEIAEIEEAVGTAPPVAHLKGRGTPLREACRTLWFNTPAATNDDQVYDCYEKYKLSNSSYIYNRYSKATLAAAAGGVRREIHEFTIRFRQYKNYSRITGGPYNYGPLPGSTDCNNGQFSYGVVTIPLTSCASIENVSGGNYYNSGTRYKGHATGQKYVDAYARFTSNGTEPIFSDYVWLTTAACGDMWVPCINTNNNYSATWNDGGYNR